MHRWSIKLYYIPNGNIILVLLPVEKNVFYDACTRYLNKSYVRNLYHTYGLLSCTYEILNVI